MTGMMRITFLAENSAVYTVGLMCKDIGSARPACAFHILEHFFADLVLTITIKSEKIWEGHEFLA